MNIYLVTRTDATGYDEFDSFVVAANSATEARLTHPLGISECNFDNPGGPRRAQGTWVKDPSVLEVQRVGIAAVGVANREVICASFNAG